MAFGFDVNNYGNSSEYMYMLSVDDIIDAPNHDETLIAKPLPPGTWQIVCTSKEATEEQAHSLVDSSTWYFPIKHTRYVDYAYPFDREFKQKWSEGFGTAKESLNSLLASKGCDLNKNWLILKKQ